MIGIPTCTLASGVTIGWANVARYPDFRALIEQRMAQGYVYCIVDIPRREVVYNNATKINRGHVAEGLANLTYEMPQFVERGDISIVSVTVVAPTPKLIAKTAQEVLDDDTIEIEQK